MSYPRISIVRIFVTAMILAVFSSCTYIGMGGDEGWLRDRQGDYRDAAVVPRMSIPSELDSFTIDDLYLIPPEPPGQEEYFVRPPAPKPIDTRVREGVTVQRFGDRSWIVIGATPGQIWPRLRDFWPTEDIPLQREDAVTGVMETDWIADEESGSRHKYQARIEPGLHSGNSEIYLRHVSDQGESAAEAPAQWPEQSDDRDREFEMLLAVSQYLADRDDLYRASSVSLLAGSIEAESKANIQERPGERTRLELRIDFERAWSQVGQALDNANIEIVDSDMEHGIYRVRFSGQEAEEPGFFSRLFRRGPSEEDIAEFSVSLQEEAARSVLVEAAATSGSAPRLQDMLIRTINENLI